MDDEACVCPFCGAEIPESDIYVEECTNVAEAICPKCGRGYSFLAGGGIENPAGLCD